LKRVSIIAMIFFFYFCGNAQENCIDSLENKSYFLDRLFEKSDFQTSTPILTTDSGLLLNTGPYILRLNANKSIEWHKKIPKVRDLLFNLSDNSSIASFYYSPSGAPADREEGLVKLNADGSLKWAKQFANNGETYFLNASRGNNDDIIVITLNSFTGIFNLTIYDAELNTIKLQKSFLIQLASNYSKLYNIFLSIDKNTIFLGVPTEKKTQLRPYVTLQSYPLTLLKLDYTSGLLLDKRTLLFNDTIKLNDFSYREGIVNFNSKFELKNGKLFLVGTYAREFKGPLILHAIKIDTNLTKVQKSIYHYDTSHTNSRNTGNLTNSTSIGPNGNIVFSAIKDSLDPFGRVLSSNLSSVFAVDKELNIILEKNYDLQSTGLYVIGIGGININVSHIPFLVNNSKGFILYHSTARDNDSAIYVADFDIGLQSSNCFGTDASFITKSQAGYTILPNPIITEVAPTNLTITPYNLTAQNEPLYTRSFCKQVSICDSIKIIGNTTFCQSNTPHTFTAFKNRQCLRKISWLVDTAVMQIIGKATDSSVTVIFKKRYKGFIYAAIDGCIKKDSLFIEVFEPAKKLDLGADTMLCPGKTITIKPTKPFKQYKWNNNSTDSTLSVRQTGKYWLTAADSCGITYTDTINVLPLDATVNLIQQVPLCVTDTATFALAKQLYNLTWQPASFGNVGKNQLQLFPPYTTTFNVTANRFADCVVTSSVTIKVIFCDNSFYMPTAFTPNNDGLNDFLKPKITGQLLSYNFSIYNRYGQLVFTTTNINNGWDGTVNGIKQPMGSFTWKCSYQFKKENAKVKKGSVLLLK
jgi:gliding motility-associated-like protein